MASTLVAHALLPLSFVASFSRRFQNIVAKSLARRWSLPPSQRPPGRSTNQRVLAAAAFLPFEPQPSPKSRRKQWFEGWFFRLTDHRALTSVAVVFGSLRRPNEPPPAAFSEHIVVVAYRDGAGVARTEAAYLDAGAVRIRGGAADAFDAPAIGGGGPRVSWWSDEHGGMVVEGDRAMLDVRVAGLRLAANVSAPRVPWDAARPDTAGPEGWLARTGLLPCHYFVHSFGSPARYRLLRRGALVAGGGAATAHAERNYGDTFPTGWVWAQASAAGGAAHLILTGGRFVIGPLTTRSYVLGVRAGALSLDFRTTDLDRVEEARHPCAGRFELNATSRDGRRRLRLRIAAPPASFGRPIPVPTLDGFSAAPGAVESYAAVADLVAHARAPRGLARDVGLDVDADGWLDAPLLRTRIELAALEFGGAFQC